MEYNKYFQDIMKFSQKGQINLQFAYFTNMYNLYTLK